MIIFLLDVLLAGCAIVEDARSMLGNRNTPLEESEPEVVSAAVPVHDDEGITGYNLFIGDYDVAAMKYEPGAGCYIGADIAGDPRLGGSMAEFDRITGKEHAFFVYRTVLGAEYPELFILKCVAERKTPLIVIEPADSDAPYDEELLYKTASEFSRLDVPVFVLFYPYSGGQGFRADDYIKFFKKAYQAFYDLSPNVAVIWGIDSDYAQDCMEFYPGDAFADWVAISITANITSDGGYKNYMDYLDYFYNLFQKTKPIMVSSLSLSHYTTRDGRYYTDLCADSLTEFYEKISAFYPRVKAVCYRGAPAYNSKIRDNYLISDEELLIKAYSGAVGNNRFLSVVSTDKSGLEPEWIKTGLLALETGGEYYVPEQAVGDIVGISRRYNVFIEGGQYLPMRLLHELRGADFFVDEKGLGFYLLFR